MRQVLTPDRAALAEPVRADEFAQAMARFAPFSRNHSFALAVSGGPDSMALALLMRDWATANRLTVQAFIVDHALRPESAHEAEATREQLKKLGLPCAVLRWEHEPVIAKLHVTARRARYGLLIEACKKAGIRDLLLAHQTEDQAETVLMRLAKGSGVDGLAGIPAENTVDGIRLLRPLLNFPKERLVATCRAEHISFIADPSNRSEKFARGRLRRVLPLLAEEGLTVERLADLASRAGDAKAALDHFTSALLRIGGRQDDAGVIRFDLEQLRAAPRAIALRAVAACLQQIRPEDYAPEHVSLAALTGALRAESDMPPRTLQGCLISKTAHEAVFIRELSAVTDSASLAPGESKIWDDRWQVTLAPGAEGRFAIRPLGNPPHEVVDKLAPGLRSRVPQGRARAALPALWRDETLALLPSFSSVADAESAATAKLLRLWPPR